LYRSHRFYCSFFLHTELVVTKSIIRYNHEMLGAGVKKM